MENFEGLAEMPDPIQLFFTFPLTRFIFETSRDYMIPSLCKTIFRIPDAVFFQRQMSRYEILHYSMGKIQL